MTIAKLHANFLAGVGGVLLPLAALAAQPGYDTFICHRGESADAPENTLPAYKMAVKRGFGFECDVYLSKDGRCFTFHDANLKRTTAGADKRRCADVTWDEVSKLDVGGWGKWKGSSYVGTRPALLEEVLELARDGRWIYIEIKSGPEIVPVIKQILAAQKKANPRNVLFISFKSAVCAEIKRQLPEYRAYWITEARQKKRGKKAGPVVSAEKVIETLRKCQADGVDMEFKPDLHTEEYIRKIHEAGFAFHVWTVDQPERSKLAFARGVETVTTNCAKRQMDAIAAEGGKQ